MGIGSKARFPQSFREGLTLKGVHARESTHGTLIECDGLESFVRDRHAFFEFGKLPLEFVTELRNLRFGEIGHGPTMSRNGTVNLAVAERRSEIALPFKVLSVPARAICRRRVRALEESVERSSGESKIRTTSYGSANSPRSLSQNASAGLTEDSETPSGADLPGWPA